jgi:prepilin-type N-terminal cleavage/methylation domain-containing protein
MIRRLEHEEGFTILELLAVLAIITILAVLLLPVLARAKASANRAACINNLRQINLAVRMYTYDHADRLPEGIFSPGADGDGIWRTYRHLVQSYVGVKPPATSADKVFTCPADTFSVGFDDQGPVLRGPAHESGTAPDFTSYLFNGFNNKTNQSAPGIAGQHLAAVRRSAKTVLVGEASAFVGFSWHRPSKALLFPDALNEVSYVDGHVDWVRIYWNGSRVESGSTCYYDPPESYHYTWSPR